MDSEEGKGWRECNGMSGDEKGNIRKMIRGMRGVELGCNRGEFTMKGIKGVKRGAVDCELSGLQGVQIGEEL